MTQIRRETNVDKAIRIQKFGRISVISKSTDSPLKVRGICECGTVKDFRASDLLKGCTQSCGCLQRELSAKRASKIFKGKYEDLTGMKFGRLTALYYTGRSGGEDRVSTWYCRCECGNEKSYLRTALISGRTKSCGCLQKELVSERMTKHGLASHPLYCTWLHMINRCFSPDNQQYHNYGGRGISVCDRWSNEDSGLQNFIEDMWPRPSDNYSIDRIDVNGNYCPENCRWATTRTQVLNTRRSLEKNCPWAFINVRTGRWYGCFVKDGKQKRFKDYNTPEEASASVYRYITDVLGEEIHLNHEMRNYYEQEKGI